MINIDSINKLYFVGIGGIGMSAAAGLAKAKGFEVSGSDSRELYSPAKDVLDREHISYHIGYDAGQIESAGADLYILSSGEGLDNLEVKAIVDKKLPHVSFAQLLYELNTDRLRIVVAGTNGKSTTTGLIGHLLKNLDDSSFIAGAVLQNYGNNFHYGDGHYIVFEGDEYKSEFDDPTPKFHYYKPDILVLTNLEFDHPDMFASLDEIKQEFAELIGDLPEDGLIVYNADDAHLPKLVHESNVSSLSFGIENEADFQAEHIDYGQDYTTLEVRNKFSKQVSAQLLGQTEQYKTQLPGKINVYNILAGIALLRSLGFQQEQLALDVLSFTGMKRRFEVVGKPKGITIIDDYAHHPTAVRETLEAARLRYFKTQQDKSVTSPKLWAVFEPHTFSRTRATLEELATSFGAADEVLIGAYLSGARKNKRCYYNFGRSN